MHCFAFTIKMLCSPTGRRFMKTFRIYSIPLDWNSMNYEYCVLISTRKISLNVFVCYLNSINDTINNKYLIEKILWKNNFERMTLIWLKMRRSMVWTFLRLLYFMWKNLDNAFICNALSIWNPTWKQKSMHVSDQNEIEIAFVCQMRIKLACDSKMNKQTNKHALIRYHFISISLWWCNYLFFDSLVEYSMFSIIVCILISRIHGIGWS